MSTPNHDHAVQALLGMRDKVIAHAVRTRKIAADRAEDYGRMFDADPGSTFRLLTASVEDGGLTPGINLGGEPFPPDHMPPTEYPREWLGAATPQSGTVTFESPESLG